MFLEGGSSPFHPSEGGGEPHSSPTPPKTMRKITVSAVSKQVQLPENKVKLSAYTVPLEKEGEAFLQDPINFICIKL